MAEGGARGRRQPLLGRIRARSGHASAKAVEPALQSIQSIPTPEETGELVVPGGSAETPTARIGRVPC